MHAVPDGRGVSDAAAQPLGAARHIRLEHDVNAFSPQEEAQMRRMFNVLFSVVALTATLGIGGCYVEREHRHAWYGRPDRPIVCRGYECRERRWW